MKSSRLSAATVFYLAFALFAIAAAVAIRYIRPVTTTTTDATLNSLTQQASDLRAFNDIELARSNELAESAKGRLWSDERLQAFADEARANGWIIQPVDYTEGVFTVSQRYLLRRTDTSFRSWPETLKFLTSACRKRGFGVHSLSIEADPGAKRQFKSISMLLTLAQPKQQSESPET